MNWIFVIKTKAVFLMMLLSCAFTAQALDGILQEFHGEWVPEGEDCLFVYMNGGENMNGWRISSTHMAGYESRSDLIKGSGMMNEQGFFTGQFKDSSLDYATKSSKTFFKTPSGMTIAQVFGAEKFSENYIHCTVDDYKTAMQRLRGVAIGKPIDKDDADFEKAWAKKVLLQYRKKPEFGIVP